MSRRMYSHPLALLLGVAAAAAAAAGIGFGAAVTTGAAGEPGIAAAPDTIDGVVVEITVETIDLYIPEDSPVWDAASTFCGVVSGLMSMMGGPGTTNCNGSFQLPSVDTAVYTLHIADEKVRMDFAGQSMLGTVGTDGSFGHWNVLDPATGRLIEFDFGDRSGGGIGAMFGSTELANLVEPIGRFRTYSSYPELVYADESLVGHSASLYNYKYGVSGGLALPNGTETGLAIEVRGMAHYANSGPYMTDANVVTVLDNLSRLMLFSHLEAPDELAMLRHIGMLLMVDEVVTIWAYRSVPVPGDIDGGRVKILWGQVIVEITDARSAQIPTSLFAALEEDQQACDCSCAGWEEVKRFSEDSREELEQNPRLMAMAACSMECMSQWMACLQ